LERRHCSGRCGGNWHGRRRSVAFLIERRKGTLATEDEHVTATNTALFVLFTIVNDLVAYRRERIDPHRDDPERWYTLPPTRLPVPPRFDTATLSYLFELPGDAPTLPMAVNVGIGKYESIFEVATERHWIHMHEVQPALEVARRAIIEDNLSLKRRVDTVFGGSRVTEGCFASFSDGLAERRFDPLFSA
jgi:hypothetical protein